MKKFSKIEEKKLEDDSHESIYYFFILFSKDKIVTQGIQLAESPTQATREVCRRWVEKKLAEGLDIEALVGKGLETKDRGRANLDALLSNIVSHQGLSVALIPQRKLRLFT